MRRQTQKIISWICALTMTASLTGTAFADTEDEALQLEDPPYMEEPEEEAPAAAEVSEPETPPEEEVGDDHAETAEADETEVSGDPVPNGPALSEQTETDGIADVPGEDFSVQSTDGEEAGQSPTLSVGGSEVDLTNGSSGEGWSYDAEDGSLVLVNCDGEEIVASGTGVTIKAAGVNVLTSLVIDGNINLIGTGILLVDSIEMAEGCDFNLLTNTGIYEDGAGSVAVFLKQEDGTYLLINGDKVPGILDEEYTIPEGVTLVVPNGSTLVMQSLAVVEYTSPEGDTTVVTSTVGEGEAISQLPEGAVVDNGSHTQINGELSTENSTSAQLIISETAKLIIEQAAAIVMNSISKQYSGTMAPELEVIGELILNGSVSGGITLLTGEDALSGAGSFDGTHLNVEADQTADENGAPITINANGSVVTLSEGVRVDALSLSGDTSLRLSNGTEVGELELNSGADVEIVAGSAPTLDTVSGNGALTYLWGSINIGGFAEDSSIEEVFATSGTVTENGNVVIAGPGNSAVTVSSEGVSPDEDGHYSIPVVNVGITVGEGCGRYASGVHESESQSAAEYTVNSNSVSIKALVNALLPTGGVGNYIEIYTVDGNGCIHMILLDGEDAESEETIPASSVSMIRTVERTGYPINEGGGVSTSTSTTFTGTGVLSNGGAGDVTGGNESTSILTGSGISLTSEESVNENGNGKTNPTVVTAAAQGIVVWAEPEMDSQGVYILRAGVNGTELSTLVGRREVRMDYKPENGVSTNHLYVIFRNTDGTLSAVKAQYDAATGKLVFTTGRLGRFVVVSMQYDGPEFSEGFYEALGRREEVKKLG